MTGEEAVALGLAGRSIGQEVVLDTALEVAGDIAVSCAPLVAGVIKRLLWRGQDMSLQSLDSDSSSLSVTRKDKDEDKGNPGSGKELCSKELCSDKDVLCICLAALLHDIGHPMLGHMFEEHMREQGHPNWEHETASNLLIDALFEERRDVLELVGITDVRNTFD